MDVALFLKTVWRVVVGTLIMVWWIHEIETTYTSIIHSTLFIKSTFSLQPTIGFEPFKSDSCLILCNISERNLMMIVERTESMVR